MERGARRSATKDGAEVGRPKAPASLKNDPGAAPGNASCNLWNGPVGDRDYDAVARCRQILNRHGPRAAAGELGCLACSAAGSHEDGEFRRKQLAERLTDAACTDNSESLRPAHSGPLWRVEAGGTDPRGRQRVDRAARLRPAGRSRERTLGPVLAKEPGYRLQRSTWLEDRGYTLVFEHRHVGIGDDAADNDSNVRGVRLLEQV